MMSVCMLDGTGHLSLSLSWLLGFDLRIALVSKNVDALFWDNHVVLELLA